MTIHTTIYRNKKSLLYIVIGNAKHGDILFSAMHKNGSIKWFALECRDYSRLLEPKAIYERAEEVLDVNNEIDPKFDVLLFVNPRESTGRAINLRKK